MTGGAVSRFLFGTLRGRLIVGVAALNALIMAVFVADLTWRDAEALVDRQVEEASALAQALATSGAGWIVADDRSGLQELVDAQRRYPHLGFVLLTDAGGLVHAASEPGRVGLRVLDLPREPRLTVISRRAALVDVVAPAHLGGRHVGWARVGVGQGPAPARLAAIARSGIGYALAAITAGSLLAWAMGRRVTRRLYAVQETINAVRGGDGRARSALSGDDEAARIAREVNAMLDAADARDARLRASEQKYRELIQGIPAAVVVHGPDTRIVTCNVLAQQLLGASEDQLLGRAAADPAWRFTRSDGTPLPVEEYPVSQVLRSGKPLRDLALGVRRPAGGDVTVLVNADPERGEGGAVSRVVVTFVDITARRKAERALAERTHVAELSAEVGHVLTRRGDLRRILQASAEALVKHLDAALARIWILDARGQVLELQASAGLSTRLDGTRARVKVGDAKVGWIAQDREAYVTSAVAGDARIDDQAWAAREGLVAFGGYPLIVEDRLVGVMATFFRRPLTDVMVKALASVANEVAVGVERKLAEEALRRSEERYRRIVETAHEGIWLTDAEGRTTFVNRLMAEMLGYGVDEMQGKPFTDFVDGEGRALAAGMLERRSRGVAEQHEFTFRRKDGSELWTLVETTPFLDAQGRYAGALGMITDVTERRRMEEQLRQSQKLEAVGRLAGGVAHDFNNLLTAILGDAEIVAEALDAADPLRADVLEIQAAAKKAAQLTRQLLAFGRKQAAQPRVIDLGEVVAAMERMLRRLIGENIELRTATQQALGAVRADPGQVEQVIVNLAVNARDAMPKGGRLTIETANVELGEDAGRRHADAKPGRYVMLAVSDSGVGMSAEVRAHLFEPFFTTKGLGRGTGLGLATVYGIVKQCGGDVWVYSEPGKGTVFEIYLPRVDAAAEPLEARAAPAAQARGTETVLVVEDEPMVRAMAVRVLRAAGYTVIDAADGEAAWRLMAREQDRPIDLLVADVVMPRLGGPELAARLRGARPGLNVLFVSGYTDRSLDLDAELGERTAFLSKPFAGADLLLKVREVLDRARAAAPAEPAKA